MTAKSFSSGEILSAADTNEYLTSGYWRRIDRSIIPSGSPVAAVTFSGISSAYRFFRIAFSVQGSASANNMSLRINNDSTGSSYVSSRVSGASTTLEVTEVTGIGYHQLHFLTGAVTTQGEVFISKPNSGNRGLIHGQTASYRTTAPNLWYYSHAGYWNNTSTLINRLDFFTSSGNFYGVVALDGMGGF